MFKTNSIRILTWFLLMISEIANAGEATCWCRASWVSLTNVYELSANSAGVVKDYTGTVNLKFSGILPQSNANQKECIEKCSTVSSADYHSQVFANSLCQAGVYNGRRIWSYAAVGTRYYDFAKSMGTLTNEPQKSICPNNAIKVGENCVSNVNSTKKCPSGWLSNTSGQNGGLTMDGVCKKMVTGCTLPPTAPQNGSLIGNYGVIQDGNVYVFGNSGNGGAAILICPNDYQLDGNNCKRTFPPTIIPAICSLTGD